MKLEIWVVMPCASKEKANRARERWHTQGYCVAQQFDKDEVSQWVDSVESDAATYWRPYKGYWEACNFLAKECLKRNANVIVYAADDIDPDRNRTAGEIGIEYLAHFPDGFGVMQPCGDMQGDVIDGKPNAARICGSPWFGREWIRRAYGGRGATCAEYDHFYGDEELKEVAQKLGVLWMRPDLIQFHRHWSWGHQKQTEYQERNSRDYWERDKTLFTRRKTEGFPGHEPLQPVR